MRNRISLLLLTAALTPGCGAEEPQDTPSPCASLLPDCLMSQQICVEGAPGEDPRCAPCDAGTYAAASGRCEAIGGDEITHDFSNFTVGPGEEIAGLCQSWTLGNATELWVNAVELAQDVASHHSNWTFVPADQFDGPDGIWPCKDRKYSQLSAALVGGVLYAQSTQASHEVQKFPNSAAVRIPPYSRIIGDVHLLNATSEAIDGHARLSLYTLPADEVGVKLVPFHLDYHGLDIPPHAKSRFVGECAVRGNYQGAASAPFDKFKLYYILPHTHAMATRFFVDRLGGSKDGESLLEIKGFDTGAHGRAYDPPIEMGDADGFRFGCDYDNPRAVSVGWGIGDQEMCELLGFAEAKAAFESTISTADPAGSDGEVRLFTGACNTLAFAWDHNKSGGPPPP